MRFQYIFLLCFCSAVLGVVSESLNLELRDSGIGFNSSVDDNGSVTLTLRWIHLIGVVEDRGSFISMLWEDRLERFLETRIAESRVNKVYRYSGKASERVANITISIDNPIPYPATELLYPQEPRLEDNLWLLEPVENPRLEEKRIFNRVYRGYYNSYGFPQPITVSFKYKTINETHEYDGELILSPDDFDVRVFDESGHAQINFMVKKKMVTLTPSVAEISDA